MASTNNNFIHGVKSKIKINGNLFDVEQMEPNFECDTDDITHTGVAPYQALLAGIERADATVTFVYDTLNKPTVSPLSLTPGALVQADFLPDGNDDFSVPCLLTGFKWSGGPKAGAVRCTATLKSTGPFTLPTS